VWRLSVLCFARGFADGLPSCERIETVVKLDLVEPLHHTMQKQLQRLRLSLASRQPSLQGLTMQQRAQQTVARPQCQQPAQAAARPSSCALACDPVLPRARLVSSQQLLAATASFATSWRAFARLYRRRRPRHTWPMRITTCSSSLSQPPLTRWLRYRWQRQASCLACLEAPRSRPRHCDARTNRRRSERTAQVRLDPVQTPSP
jgi:hypothetical protein